MVKNYIYEIKNDTMRIKLLESFEIIVKGNLGKVIEWYNNSRNFRELREKVILSDDLVVSESWL